jgi:hypothetical protein
MVSKVRTRVGSNGESKEVIVAPIGSAASRKDLADARRGGSVKGGRKKSTVHNVGGNKIGSSNVGVNKVGVNKVGVNKVGVNKVGVNNVGGNNGGSAKVKKIGKKKKIVHEENLVWDSGLKVISPPILIDVPKSIVDVMRAIDISLADNVEFSIYVKADVSNIECIVVSEDYYIPKQTVSAASVDYNESPIDGFNAVIHKHPRGVMSFSGTDDEYINQNFTVSILWCGGNFVDATVNYDAGAGIKLQLEGYVYVDDIDDLPDVDVSNIVLFKHTNYMKSGTPGAVDICIGSGMQTFAEAYGYYAGANELDDNGVPVAADDLAADDLDSESRDYERTRQALLRCGME